MEKSFHFFFIRESLERISFLFYNNNISWHFFCSEKLKRIPSLAHWFMLHKHYKILLQFVVHKLQAVRRTGGRTIIII